MIGASSDITTEMRELKRRLADLERASRLAPLVIPFVFTGAVQNFGFSSIDATSYTNVFRCDFFATAPYLHFNVQTSTAYGTSITSVEWRLRATVEGGSTYTIVSSTDPGISVGSSQFAGSVDVFSKMSGDDVLGKLVRLDVEVKRTGGSGDAAIRLVRPMLLRAAE